MRRQRVVAVIVALALGLPALFGIATGIGLLVTPSVDDMPKRVDALLKQHGGTRVHLNDIPDQLSEALIAIEDERFYQHSGIDTQGLIRAVLTDLYRHRALQGGSTLSQQLMKVVYMNNDDDGWRKPENLLLALKIEARFDKHTILENYFNAVYYGWPASPSHPPTTTCTAIHAPPELDSSMFWHKWRTMGTSARRPPPPPMPSPSAFPANSHGP